MAYKIINETSLTAIGNAIRSKTGSPLLMSPATMASTITSSWNVPGAHDVCCVVGPIGNNLNRMMVIKPLNNMIEDAQYDYEIDLKASADTTEIGLFVSQAADDAFLWLSPTAGTRETLTGTFTLNYVSGYTPQDDPINAQIIVYQYPRTIDNLTEFYSIKITPHISGL